MTTEIVTAEPQSLARTNSPGFFAMEPEAQVKYATRIATVLADVIDKQKLYTTIQGKNYVRVEGWQTLGTFLGVTVKEKSVSRLNDGSYEASVDLIKFSDGTIVGGASALCSISEKRWGNADDYARRSMSITRATGKAFRCSFSWIIALAGYEVTPEEEIPREEKRAEPIKAKTLPEIFKGEKAQVDRMEGFLKKNNVPAEYWAEFSAKMKDRPIAQASAALKELGFDLRAQ